MSNPVPDPEGAPLLTIGAVAAMTGRSTSAIRYYEQIGLLPEPVRVGGRRRYDPATVRTLAVIERSELVRGWLELAARCECPDLGQCPLFDDPALPPGPGANRPPSRAG